MIFNKNKLISKTILIVEDELPIRQAIIKKLRKEGFNVLEAGNGMKGLKISIEAKPDLILLDIIMPVMDGIRMLNELRKDKWGKDAKVIILTNLTDAGNEIESFQKGVEDYLIKSDWKINDLVIKIKEKLNI